MSILILKNLFNKTEKVNLPALLYADVPAKERLKRLLNFVENFGFDNRNFDNKCLLPVFSFIRMLSDRLYSERIIEVISKDSIRNESGYKSNADFNLKYLITDFHKNDSGLCKKISGQALIELAYHPVICNVWDGHKLLNTFNDYATINKPWEFSKGSHIAELYLPFGLTVVNTGNHSVSAGVLKREGTLQITDGKIYDLSPMYDKYRFDGINYLDNTDKIAFKANSFEFGVIYETGRIIRRKGIKFLNIDYYNL